MIKITIHYGSHEVDYEAVEEPKYRPQGGRAGQPTEVRFTTTSGSSEMISLHDVTEVTVTKTFSRKFKHGESIR